MTTALTDARKVTDLTVLRCINESLLEMSMEDVRTDEQWRRFRCAGKMSGHKSSGDITDEQENVGRDE